MKKKTALIILDGWGIIHNPKVSAIEAAHPPFMEYLLKKYPNAVLTTHGELVGLPDGQMGNSEVGHMNIGAGRVVYQELVRINKAFQEFKVESMPVFQKTILYSKNNKRRIHIMGLLSDGGVHSHIQHLIALCTILKKYTEIEVFVHIFLDGRDTDPRMGASYIKQVKEIISESNIQIASVIGRYYAMDRDHRWQRTKLAYDLLVHGTGQAEFDLVEGVKKQYLASITDEFMVPLKNKFFDNKNMNLQPDDVIINFNFRTDRPRQITSVLTQENMLEFDMSTLPLHVLTFTEYDRNFKNIQVLFEKDNLLNTLGEVLSKNGKTQLRVAETEKYPHVTFFFNGGREKPFEGEERIMVPSPKVATYDLQPEMSAKEVTEKTLEYVRLKQPDFICLNYANTDMVGHTGDFEAAIIATKTVDQCLQNLVPTLLDNDYQILIIADHGNSDVMINEDGSPNTAHTLSPVPIILITSQQEHTIRDGKLGDIAPTLLYLMDIEIPQIMRGEILVNN
ncbi:MAG: 2,3-bisphosphoglycerate-independent phosphoglycerate mutase [Saprospiraceae bacterium]